VEPLTVCGFSIGDGQAWAWADAEAYDDGAPSGRDVRKMGVSVGGAVVIGAGDASVVGEVAQVAAQLKTTALLVAVETMAEAAQYVAAAKRGLRESRGAALPPSSHFGVVGVEGGRLRGFTMRQAEGFRLVEVEAWASPASASQPRSAAEVLAVALAQLEIIKREFPGATGRALTIAKIGPLGVATTTVRL